MPARPVPRIQPGPGQSGLTLIELVVAIVVIAVAATAVMLLLATGYRSSADPQLRIKAVELGQSYMDEIFAKRWDENTPLGGGCVVPTGTSACDPSNPQAVCPGSGSCGPDGTESRATFDDVDDYAGLQEGTCYPANLRNASGNPRQGRYDGFCVEVAVTTGVGGGELQKVPTDDAKRVDVRVTGPRNFTTTFTAYRLNF